MHRRLTTHKHLLNALHTLKPKYQRALLKTYDEEEINCICECIHNVLQGKVPLKDHDISLLSRGMIANTRHAWQAGWRAQCAVAG